MIYCILFLLNYPINEDDRSRQTIICGFFNFSVSLGPINDDGRIIFTTSGNNDILIGINVAFHIILTFSMQYKNNVDGIICFGDIKLIIKILDTVKFIVFGKILLIIPQSEGIKTDVEI